MSNAEPDKFVRHIAKAIKTAEFRNARAISEILDAVSRTSDEMTEEADNADAAYVMNVCERVAKSLSRKQQQQVYEDMMFLGGLCQGLAQGFIATARTLK